MKAVTFSQFGAANEVLTVSNVTTPDPKPGEVLVRLAVSAVNPFDVKKRAGALPDLLVNGPVTPHSDGAGVIGAIGEGVTEDRLGERGFYLPGAACAIDGNRGRICGDLFTTCPQSV